MDMWGEYEYASNSVVCMWTARMGLLVEGCRNGGYRRLEGTRQKDQKSNNRTIGELTSRNWAMRGIVANSIVGSKSFRE